MSRQASGMSVHQRLEAASDLSGLSPISDDLIVSCLRERFMSESIYTNIGSNSLVAVNPHKYVSSNADSVLQKYASDYRDTSENKSPIPPHIFQLANNAYYHMRRTTQDQSIIISGETGSGKSENRRLAIKTLLELSVSNPGKKGSKLAIQLPAAEFVIESFGNARTLFNPNASRFGKYTELQFTDRGRLSGVKTLDYYLERNRVSSVPSGERNFHIFYYLVAGATSEERQHLHLLDKTQYRYLGQRGAVPARQNGVRDDDANRFEQLKVALKSIGLSKRHVAQTCQLLAAILHLGNLEFTVDRGRDVDAAVVRNTDVLAIVAEFLGVQTSALEGAMSYKTKLMKKELCTVFLDPDGASDNRDDLAKTLYSLLFAWLNEHINQRLCREDFDTFIGLFDLPGPQNMTSRPNSLDQFCVNFANERLQNFVQRRIFEAHVDEYQNEGISRFVPTVPYFDNTECVRLLQNKPGGLIHIMDDQARRSHKKTDHSMVEAFGKRWGNHSSFKVGAIDRSGFPTFTVNHFNWPRCWVDEPLRQRPLLGQGYRHTSTPQERRHHRHNQTPCPTLREGGIEEQDRDDDDITAAASNGTPCVAGEFRSALDTLFDTLADTQTWYVFCINPNDSQLPNQLEGRSVKGQVRSLGLTEIAKRNVNVFEVGMTPEEFCQRYRDPMLALGVSEGSPRERVEQTRTALTLRERDVVLGQYKVFMSQAAFHSLEDRIRASDVEEQKRNRIRDAEAEAGLDVRGFGDPYAPYSSPGANNGEESPFVNAFSDPALPLVSNASPFQRADLYDDEYDERKSFRSDDFDNRSRLTSNRDDSNSNYGTESYAPSRNMFQNADKEGLMVKEALPGEIGDSETTEIVKETSARRRWVAVCWGLTWWMPSLLLRWVGRMKREDVRQAWREKLAINFIIWFFCACAVFVIVFLGEVICPTEHVFSTSELASHSYTSSPNNVYTSVRGEVFDLTTVAATHQRVVSVVPIKNILQTYGGTASDKIFPVQVSALCNGVSGTVSPYVTLNSANDTDPNAAYHDFRAFTNDSRPDWYFESMTVMRWNNRVGYMGYTPAEISTMANTGSSLGIYNGLIYDLTSYVNYGPAVQPPSGQQLPGTIDDQFMDSSVVGLFKYNSGQDLTKQFDALPLDSATLDRQRTCLRNLFLIGMVDNRNSPQCQFAEGILLALSILMVSIIGFKFIASINFAAPRAPEDHDKFVICQVPCYTEGETSLKRTIDSLAQLKYDDKRKLILVICDGNIVGSGNDRPTPRIVLDILGADPNLDPEPLSFVSLGEGARQHNMGKVYSGLYECAGHVVPYLVVVKIGKPSERSRPGNRGKRDSQMVIMHFLNKVHFSTPMNPLELEMFHQIKNVIGVNPTFFEYLFTVDADTTVEPYSVNRLISACIHDKKVLGVCGETELSNAKQSIITMMQVYEYFISHHMAKAFESLFGSVTCLPGCFTLYRLRTPDTHKPLLISNQMVQDYSQNRVDTLHMKNLLHLGEDRYLTTLLLKHFPMHKTQFVRDAHAFTVAPDDWKILLSQRRRWINSTVHNLGELMFLEQLCGFCCFSMRFVVMIDLVSTIIQPITVGYIVYLIVEVTTNQETLPIISLVMIGAVYGLQALVFILRRKWDMVGWMFFYILAIPIFSLMLPLYSFWRMDDFSWGATRVVLGESGKKIIVHDEGKFDPRAIPLKSWNDYENELWDKESNHSIGSWVPPPQFNKEGYAASATASLYGRETYYEPRSHSPAPSQFGMMPPPGYQSGRNTPMSQLRPMSDVGMMYQPMPSRPPTNYLDMPMPPTRSHEELSSGAPTDAELDHAVHEILRTADLNSVTKREIRRQLEERFGMDLTSRKGTINAAIDRVLLSQA
ncbi:glycosyltransferase family 2 protein [Suillus paluster]|uniref:glycosyltransferase family 2 protein n=1 Tax=Suillus paluster TaxID=48578 RepID=UPI001B86F5D1|nr:glycosyltransferase family 2 protein [Suillus paluster]KAG1722688.1 glycosyltransferase family 2 protein [Suillus paluster]